MRRFLFTLLFSLLVPYAACADDVQDVRDAFDLYKSAVVEQRGDIAAELVTDRTLDECKRIRDWSLTADRAKLEKLSLSCRMFALALRHGLRVDDLRKLDGRGAFAHAVDRDLICKASANKMELGDVKVSNDAATAEVLIDGKKAPMHYVFKLERGIWKIDLAAALTDPNGVLVARSATPGVSETEQVLAVVETVSGRKVTDQIWEPVN